MKAKIYAIFAMLGFFVALGAVGANQQGNLTDLGMWLLSAVGMNISAIFYLLWKKAERSIDNE